MPIQQLTKVRKRAVREKGWKLFRLNPNATFSFPMYRSHLTQFEMDTKRVSAPVDEIGWETKYKGGVHFFDLREDAEHEIERWWQRWLFGPVLLCRVEGPVHVKGIEDGTAVSVARWVDILKKEIWTDVRVKSFGPVVKRQTRSA